MIKFHPHLRAAPARHLDHALAPSPSFAPALEALPYLFKALAILNWTRPAALRSQLQKLQERGDLLASIVTGEAIFPRRLTLKGPTSQGMTDRFGEVRAWVGELRALPHCRVEMREFRHRLFGTNAVLQEVWIDTLDDAPATAAIA